MAPGLAFMQSVVIDSHFAERGRMGRLLGAVAQNPCNTGLGIDEDTTRVVTSSISGTMSIFTSGRCAWGGAAL
jgi:cyanophycinase